MKNNIRIGSNARSILSNLAALGPATSHRLLMDIKPLYGSERWGHSFFVSGTRNNGHEASLLLRGLVQQVGVSRTRARVFEITPLGLEVLGL